MRRCFIYRNREPDTDWMNRCQTVKAWVCFRRLLPKILGSLGQFYEIQIGGWPREVLHVVKTRTIRKLDLNICDKFVNLKTENFFVSLCFGNIYTM